MDANRDLDDVIDSVADGRAIEWASEDSHAPDEDTRDLLKQLRVIADVAGAHRASPDWPASDSATRESSAPAEPVKPTSSKWGRYDLLERLGAGTFGSVYRAWDPELERHIAIKLLYAREGAKETTQARMLREGRALARVRHSNVVSVYSAEVHDGQVGLCMELVSGRTLDEIVKTQGTLSAQEATIIGQTLCSALAAVHGAGLIHRDVKARNVMREDGGRIVLMDFGTGQAQGLSNRRGSPIAGTPIYMAPETLAGQHGTVASDIYSVGVLLFFLVTGRYPVEGSTMEEVEQAHIRGRRRYVGDLRPDLSAPFVRAVERALDPDPVKRHPSAASLLVELITANAGGAVLPEPGPSPWQVVRRFLTPSVLRVLGYGASALLVTFLLGFFNSWAYFYSVGLDSSFISEGPLSYVRWGFRSMVAPVFLMVAVWLLVLVALEVVKLVRRVSPAADLAFRRLGLVLLNMTARSGLAPSSALASALVAASLAFVWWVIFGRFGDLIEAVQTPIDTATIDVISRLALSNEGEHQAYRQVLSLGLLVMVYGWMHVIRLASLRREPVQRIVLIAGLVTTSVTAVLLDIPYRILWQNEVERVAFEDTTCYVVGSRADALRLFCPERDPRSVVAPRNHPTLKSGPLESIFTPYSRPKEP